MSSRKPHHKSRTGCTNCKKRRVKCDEQKPQCQKCMRNNLHCGFETRSKLLEVTSINPKVELLPAPYQARHHTLNMTQLELLHHFCTSTYYTLSDNHILRVMYQTNVVKLGFTCEYVMYSILSISALHLSRLAIEKERYFLSQALNLHQLALITGAPSMVSITDENCNCIYIFTVLTFMFDFARAHACDTAPSGEKADLVDWVFMLRGTRTVFESSSAALLRDGPLGPLFTIGERRAQAQASSSAASAQTDHLWELQRLINDTATNSDEIDTYNLSIDSLRLTFNIVFNKHPDTYEATDVLLWLYKLTDHFVELLSQRKPEALVILAHFSILLKELDSRWWIHGWSKRLISQIYGEISEEYRLGIVWPIKEIGWIPETQKAP